MGQNNIIELNGKQYDAVTGKQIGESRIKATPHSRQSLTTAKPAATTGRALDGVVRAKPSITPRVTTAPGHNAPGTSAQSAAKPDIRRPRSHTIKPHKAERSQTLMRHVVKKPVVAMKPAIKTTAPAEHRAKSTAEIGKPLEKKLSASQVNPVRLSHAQHIAKSHHVKRFDMAPQATSPAIAAHKTVHPVQPLKPHVATPAAHHQVAAKPQAARHNQQSDIFEAALARAQSHAQPKPRAQGQRSQRNRRFVNALAGVAAFLVIGGFVAYLNASKIELQVASVHAGFNASMPSYSPTGYALNGGIDSQEGKVAMKFRSGDSSYQITQVASDWNSQTLLDYYTENHGTPEQTVESQGRTIYLYDDNRAAWVNGGVRFEINGNANLSTRDLVSMATSL